MRNVLAQVFIRPRGILKISQVWLPLSLILVAGTRVSQRAQLGISLYLLFAIVSKGLASILINDLTDREIDRRAGKERWITDLPFPAGSLIPVLLLAAGFFALLKAGGGFPVFAAFTASVLLGIFYSLRPVRFKERGIWGVSAYALSAAILHAVVPWTLFRPAFLLLPLLFSALLGEKLVQILFHQIVDFDSDSAMKVRSFAVTAGREKSGRILRAVLTVAVMADLALLFFVFYEIRGQPLFFRLSILGCLGGVAASGLYVRLISKKCQATRLTEMLPWAYLGLSYSLFYLLPPLLFLNLALPDPKLWVLVALSALSLLGVSINTVFYDPKR